MRLGFAIGLVGLCASCHSPARPVAFRAGGLPVVAATSPRLVGIAFDGRMADTFEGEVMRPMTLEPVVEGVEPGRLRFAWRTDATFVGWDQQRLFHLLPTAAGACNVTLRAWTSAGEFLGERTAVVRVRRASPPPL
jgi:hypothetical protein